MIVKSESKRVILLRQDHMMWMDWWVNKDTDLPPQIQISQNVELKEDLLEEIDKAVKVFGFPRKMLEALGMTRSQGAVDYALGMMLANAEDESMEENIYQLLNLINLAEPWV